MKRTLLVLFAAALAACDGQTVTSPIQAGEPSNAVLPRTVYLDQSFTMRVSETVSVSGESLTVRFDAVTEDSRCPTGVQCFWAGNARVAVTLAKTGSAAQSLGLNTGLEPRIGSYLDYTIELVSLAPYPSATRPIAQRDYRATFVVRKNPPLNTAFNIKVGQTRTIAGQGLNVTFDGVLSDSRCPIDVNCFWQGNAEVQVTLSKAGNPSSTVVLNTGVSPNTATYLNYEVELTDLNPDPVSTSTINPNDYVATLIVRTVP